MDPTIVAVMTQLGWAQYVPVVLALIGLASAVSAVWPPTWPGAAMIHKIALLVGHARPAVPAGVANDNSNQKGIAA